MKLHITASKYLIMAKAVGSVREVVASDIADVQEMARHTYGGHDWIMSEFNKWVVRKTRSYFLLHGLPEDGSVLQHIHSNKRRQKETKIIMHAYNKYLIK